MCGDNRTIFPKMAVSTLNWTCESQPKSANDQYGLLVPVAHRVKVLYRTVTGPPQLRVAGQGLDLTLFFASFKQLFLQVTMVPVHDA